MIVWIYYVRVLKKRLNAITDISSMVRVKRSIIVEFVLRNQLLMSFKLIYQLYSSPKSFSIAKRLTSNSLSCSLNSAGLLITTSNIVVVPQFFLA
jgi:hypothetical protein